MTAARLKPILQQIRTAGGGAGSDRQLLDAFVAKRDAAAFAALVGRHGPLVLAACRGVLRDAADVDDAFQAAFVTLFRKAGTIRSACLSGWLFRVARRVALESGRAAERRRRCESLVSPATALSAPDLSWREACAILHEELDRLPDRYRLPLLLCGLEGLSRDEAARQLGWSLNEVRGRLERGRQALRLRLQKRGVAPAVGLLALLGAADATAMSPELLRAALKAVEQTPPAIEALVGGASAAIGSKAKFAIALLLAAGLVAGIGAPTTPAGPAPAEPPAKAAPAPIADEDSVAVSGQVLDSAGKPFANVPIFAISTDYRGTLKLDKPVATSDAAGRFSCQIAEVKHDPRSLLLAWPAGYGPAWANVFSDVRDQFVTLRPPLST